MFREYFLGLGEVGIASELGVSSLSVPEKLLRPKEARTGAGSSLPYAEFFLVFYLLCPLICGTSFCVMQKQANGIPVTSVCPTRTNEDERRSDLSLATFLQVSLRCPRSLKLLPKTTTPLRMASQRSEALRDPKRYRPSRSSFHYRLSFPTLPQPIVPQPNRSQSSPALILPNDMPNSAQTKMGPLGQIAGGIRQTRSRRNRERTSGNTFFLCS